MKNGQKGFSLMEVLITVGLVAILTAIAIPSYRNYLRTAKRTEAQTSLSQLYMAEKAFFIQWRFYTSDLLVAGVIPEGEHNYNVGFNTQHAPNKPSYKGPDLDGSRNNFSTLCGPAFGSGILPSCAFKNKQNPNGFTPPNILSVTKCTNKITDTEFTAIAIADLLNKTPTNLGAVTGKDIWCIDQYKQVTNACNGTNSSNSCP